MIENHPLDFLKTHKNWVVPIPSNMSFEEAAAFGVATLTAWLALHRAAKIKSSETVLILGASGGVGMMAVQLANLAGAHVIASVGHRDKFATARELGAKAVVVTDSTLGEQLEQIGHGIDAIIDLVGGPHLGQALHSAKPRARAVIVGYSAAPTTSLNIIDLLRNEIVISGFNLFSADPADIGAAIADMMSKYAQGKIKVLVDRVFPLSQAEAATQHRLSRNAFGRVVLKPEHA